VPGCGTDPLPIVRYDAKDRQRRLDLMRWGLLPFWAKDIKVGFSNINAKAEVIENKHAFREAFRQRRCLMPVDNFYEWKKTESGKQQAALWRSRSPTAAAWRSRAYAKTGVRRPVNVFAASRSSPRSPTNCAPSCTTGCLVLKPEAWPEWLGEEPADETRLKSLLAPTLRTVRWHVVLAGERACRQRQKQRPVADQTGCRSLDSKRRPKSIAGHISYARRVPQSTTHGGFKMPLRKVSLRNPAGSENPAVSPWLCQLI